MDGAGDVVLAFPDGGLDRRWKCCRDGLGEYGVPLVCVSGGIRCERDDRGDGGVEGEESRASAGPDGVGGVRADCEGELGGKREWEWEWG